MTRRYHKSDGGVWNGLTEGPKPPMVIIVGCNRLASIKYKQGIRYANEVRRKMREAEYSGNPYVNKEPIPPRKPTKFQEDSDDE